MHQSDRTHTALLNYPRRDHKRKKELDGWCTLFSKVIFKILIEIDECPGRNYWWSHGALLNMAWRWFQTRFRGKSWIRRLRAFHKSLQKCESMRLKPYKGSEVDRPLLNLTSLKSYRDSWQRHICPAKLPITRIFKLRAFSLWLVVANRVIHFTAIPHMRVRIL